MKKIFFIAILITVFVSCKNDSKSDTKEQNDSEKTANQNDGLTSIKGDFIYYADAAILQTDMEVYGVVIDEKMHELNSRVKKFQQEDTDMVPVEIRGKIIPKPKNEEGWPYRVEIKEILNIYQPSEENTNIVRLGS